MGLLGQNPILFRVQAKTGPYNWRRLWEELDLILGDFGLTLEMQELGLHQPMIGPHQDDDNLHQAESGGSQHNNSVANPQQRGDREGSMHITHTSKSQSRGKSHVSHSKSERDIQCEIEELKKKLHHVR